MRNIAQVYIDCGTEEAPYQIFLAAESMSTFETASKSPETQGKNGEELVAAILAVCGEDIIEIGRAENGKWNDGPNGEPAIQKFHKGILIENQHFQDGLMNDAADGTPAHIMFNAKSGNVAFAASYQSGQKVRELGYEEMAMLRPRNPEEQKQKKEEIAKANPAIKVGVPPQNRPPKPPRRFNLD
jgi:hypothetical protein